MDNYQHIKDFEITRTKFEEKISQLDDLLNFFEENESEFDSLMKYYYSDQRNQDLEDDENGLIPPDLKRGVLSQDEIYNLYSDYRNLSLKMLELGTNFFKNN